MCSVFEIILQATPWWVHDSVLLFTWHMHNILLLLLHEINLNFEHWVFLRLYNIASCTVQPLRSFGL